MQSLLLVFVRHIEQVILCLYIFISEQGVVADENREGRCSGVYFGNAYTKRICQRLDRNVADKTLFEYLYRVVVEYFSP